MQGCLDFKGPVSIRPQTPTMLIEEIIPSLAHQGFKEFVLVNAHGGNWVLSSGTRLSISRLRSPSWRS
ncbi:MAG: creatininase family protein [Planctomycetota bacterium]